MNDDALDTPPDELVPAWSRNIAVPWLNGQPWPRGNDVEWREVEGSGWPLIALSSERRRAANFTQEQRWGLVVPGKGRRHIGQFFGAPTPRVLPLRPVWPGFIVNTLAYATVWLVLLMIPGAIRGRRRTRKGLCRHCGYDLSATPSTNPCPECGRIARTR